MSKPSNKKKKVGQPSKVVYAIAYLISKLIFAIKGIKLELDTSALSDLKGPAVIIAPHTSALDPIILGIACYPKRLSFVVSEHFVAKPLTRFAFTKLAHVITKKMFCPDASTIMNIMRAKNEGNIVVMFPEGRLNSAPHSHPVTPGTAELIKKLGVDVYCITANGASLVYPKWSKTFRKGKVLVTAQKLFEGSSLRSADIRYVSEVIDGAILHDDEKAMCGEEYICSDTTKGLDKLLYKCPRCFVEFKTHSDDSHIECKECGFVTKHSTQNYFEDCRFSTINEWYLWQYDELDIDSKFEFDADIGTVNEKGNMDLNAGNAHITIDKDTFRFDGTVYGEALEFELSTPKIGGTPYTANREFDIYFDKRLYYIMPKERKTVVKYAMFIDKVCQQQRSRKDSDLI